MTDVIAKGYAEKVPSHSAEEEGVWYIPLSWGIPSEKTWKVSCSL